MCACVCAHAHVCKRSDNYNCLTPPGSQTGRPRRTAVSQPHEWEVCVCARPCVCVCVCVMFPSASFTLSQQHIESPLRHHSGTKCYFYSIRTEHCAFLWEVCMNVYMYVCVHAYVCVCLREREEEKKEITLVK